MITLGDVKQSSAIDIAQIDPDSAKFIRLLNDATRRLMRRGDWEGTIVPIHVCVRMGCIVWPRYVGQVRKINLCGRGREIQNVWYDFLPSRREHWWGSGWHYCNPRLPMVNVGYSSVFQDIMGEARTVRAYPSTPLDNNKTVTIFGEDNNGQRLMTQGSGGWRDGMVLTLNAANVYTETRFAGNPVYVRRIDRVLKDVTEGPVRLYGCDSANNVLEDLAVLEPSETRPWNVKSRLNPQCCSGCATNLSVLALVKLKFIPVVNDYDWVLIDNLDALKMMMLSIRAEDATDYATKKQYEADAVAELNLQLWDEARDNQVPVETDPFAQTNIGCQQVF
jgi:hypothetical protein